MEEHTAVATLQPSLPPEIVDKVVIGGDLADLDAVQRAEYYNAVCRSVGLNPLTKPFEYLNLNGKLRLYALRDCADQLRRLHGISIYIANREQMSDIYVVTARAEDRQGREDESTGAVTVGNLKGDALANALMKAETKAKRRVTLSIAGLGSLDETELDTIPQDPSAVIPSKEPPASEEPPAEVHPTADHINSLVEMASACGVEHGSFGRHMRQLLDLPTEAKITKKFLRETMTMAQYKSAWQYYNEVLKKQVEAELQKVEEEILDYPPPGDDTSPGESEAITSPTEEGQQTEPSAPVSTADVSSDDAYATPQQIAALKRLAQQVGDDAYGDVQDMLEHHREGIGLDVYEIVKQRLRARKAAKQEATPVHQQG